MDLFERNRTWAAETTARDPEFFRRLQNQQSPEYLWIGCSDSRVPANDIVGLAPGELFVHRNIANVVVHTDLNCLSVLQFAVDVLKVKHVIVCGHYGCSGIRASLQHQRLGLIDNWLRHIQDIQMSHEQTLLTVRDDVSRADVLCELNVIEQVINICQTTIVDDAWTRGQTLSIHGWVYGLHDGRLRDLGMTVDSMDHVTPTYKTAISGVQERASRSVTANPGPMP